MSKKLARATGLSVKEGITFLALLGSFLTDILTPLGAFSGGLAAVGFVALLFSGSIWAMRRFPDSTENGQIAHSKWAVLVSGGVTIICTGLYAGQVYASDIRASQLGLLANYLPVVEDAQKKLAPKAHARALEDIQKELKATRAAAEGAEDAATEAAVEAAEASDWAELTYKEITYTNTPEKIRTILRKDNVAPGIPAQLVRKYPFEEEITGSEALDILNAFPDDYRRDIMKSLVKSIAPGMAADDYLAFIRPLASGTHVRGVTSLINPKVTEPFDWRATRGFWRDCFDRFSTQVCRWKAYTISPAFDDLHGSMLIHITKQFVEHGGSGNVIMQLRTRGATARDLSPKTEQEIQRFMQDVAAEDPARHLSDITEFFRNVN